MEAYIGIDAHTTNYTLTTRIDYIDKAFNQNTYSPKVSNIVQYCKGLRKQYKGEEINFHLGYEAGCLGFQLKRDIEQADKTLHCVVMAPASIPGTALNRRRGRKTDKRDSDGIAQSLQNHQYSEVFTPDEDDEAVRDYIRMREDHKEALTKVKQQIVAFCHRHGFEYESGKNKWTKKYIKWLKNLKPEGFLKDTLDEYLTSYEQITFRISEMDKKIEEIAKQDKYYDAVHALTCFKGIKTLTALSMCVEICDFRRFEKAKNFASFLGLASGEQSSSTDQNLGSITKQGNTFLRKLLTEAAQSFSRARPGKSKELEKRQSGNSPQIIAYADKANERLRKRYYHLVLHNKKCHNKATTAIARELACFIWGMMTGHIQVAA